MASEMGRRRRPSALIAIVIIPVVIAIALSGRNPQGTFRPLAHAGRLSRRLGFRLRTGQAQEGLTARLYGFLRAPDVDPLTQEGARAAAR